MSQIPQPPQTPQQPSTTSPLQFPELAQRIMLPSRGVPYVASDGSALLKDGSAVVRSMTGEDEAILNADGLLDQVKLARVLDNCAHVEQADGRRFSNMDLLTTDRLMLMLFVRAVSLSVTYRLPLACGSCGYEGFYDVDLLTGMDVEEMPRRHLRRGADPTADDAYEVCNYDPRKGIEVTLPKCRKAVALRLLTGRDEEFIAREAAKGGKSGFLIPGAPGKPENYLRSMLSIKAIEGTVIEHSSLKDMQALHGFVRRLPYADLQYIGATVARHDVGVATEFSTTCPKCVENVTVPFRLTAEFFRPTDE